MPNFSLASLRQAQALIAEQVPPTAQHCWPLLAEALDCEVWVKHENHAPTGAFKVRGAITYIDWLKREHPGVTGIITATRASLPRPRAASRAASAPERRASAP